jgi:hypothetical protein
MIQDTKSRISNALDLQHLISVTKVKLICKLLQLWDLLKEP